MARRYVRPVLIVDDDVDHAVIARTVLASMAPDAPVVMLTDTRGLEERLTQAEHGAVVLIDRVLGLAESYPIITRVSRERPDLSFVMLSAVLSAEDGRRALDAGALAAEEKPGTLAGWRTLLAALLDRAGEAASGATGPQPRPPGSGTMTGAGV